MPRDPVYRRGSERQPDEFVELRWTARTSSRRRRAAAVRPPHAYVFIGAQTAYVQDFDEVVGSSSVAGSRGQRLTTGSVLDVGVINTSEVTIVAEARAVRGAPAHRR